MFYDFVRGQSVGETRFSPYIYQPAVCDATSELIFHR